MTRAKKSSPAKVKKRRGGCGRKALGLLFVLALLLAVGLGAVIMFMPAQDRQDLRGLVRGFQHLFPGNQHRFYPIEPETSTAPLPPPNPPHETPDRDVPESAQNLPPAPVPPPPPVANTASEKAIPPAPPAPFPLPTAPLAGAQPRVAQLWNGVVLRTQLAPKPSAKTALELAALTGPVMQNRVFDLRLTLPKPHQSLPALLELNPDIAAALPGLPALLASAQVSPLYGQIYNRKVAFQRDNATRLDSLLSNHNFYDTETILELQAPGSGRRALLLQSEMDTLTDGSDGDRFPEIVGESPSFQPFTSYAWPKQSTRPNPFLAKIRAQIAEADQAGARSRLATLRSQANELRNRSFLVGWIDPFIALPMFVLKTSGAYGVEIGDLAVVIYKGQAYPALVGDAGPNEKLGEASYLICQAINPGSNAMDRPENDLKVTYLVFPNTAQKPFGPPSVTSLRDRANTLLRELDPAIPLQAYLWPAPPIPIGYDEAIAADLADFKRHPEFWPPTSPFQTALEAEEPAGAPEQMAELMKATPKAK